MSDSEKTYSNCSNCGEPMWPENSFCSDCGQKAYQGPPSFWQLIGDFFETVFSLDNRLFRTLAALMIPGKLTNSFLSGKQKPYFHPLRLFFVSGVLMVAAYSMVTTQSIGDTLDKTVERRRAKAYEGKFNIKLLKGVDSIQASFPAPAIAGATDSLINLMNLITSDSSYSIDYISYSGGLNFEEKRAVFNDQDYSLMTPSELAENYGVKGVVDKYIFKQRIRLERLGVSGVSSLMGQAIWGLLLLVPLSAALLKLIYLRRKRKYIEHFIFTLHTHSFLFLTQFFAALELLISGTPWLLIFSGLATVIYFLLAMKRVYRQRWIKTIFKAAVISWGYLFLLPAAIAVAAVVAVLFY